MATVLARIHVDAQGRVTGQVPATVPPGDYEAPLLVEAISIRREASIGLSDHSSPPFAKPGPARLNPFLHRPPHQKPWDDSISLRREDLYDDEGR